MPKLIILNGPCGVGKNTIAQRYAAANPLTLILDIDEVRRMLSNYREQRVESAKQSYALADALCRAHLLSGYGVIVPNLIRDPMVLDSFASIAAQSGAEHYELVLDLPKETAIERATQRGFRPGSLLTPDRLGPMYDELMQALEQRSQTRKIDASGDEETTYANFFDVFSEH